VKEDKPRKDKIAIPATVQHQPKSPNISKPPEKKARTDKKIVFILLVT